MLYFQPDNATSSDDLLFPSEQIPVRLDIQTVDNTEIGSIFGDLSQPFEIAASEVTNRYFKYAFDANGQEIPGVFSPIPGSLQTEHNTLLKQCSLFVESWDSISGTYSCKIEASIIPINDLFSDINISGEGIDYDASNPNPWDAHDHDYSMATWKARETDALQPAYFYPFIDFGFDKDGRPRIPDPATVSASAYASAVDNNNTVNQDYRDYLDRYGDDLIGQAYLAQTNHNIQRALQPTAALLEATPFFGEVSRRQNTETLTQGFISHPTTPLRIDQLKPAVKLSTIIDVLFSHASRKAGKEITYDISSWSDDLANCYVLPNEKDGLGLNGTFTSTFGASVIQQVSSSNTSQDVSLGSILSIKKSAEDDNRFQQSAILGEDGFLNHTNSDYDSDAWNNSSDHDGQEWTIPYDGSYKLVFKGAISVDVTGFSKDRHRANFVPAIIMGDEIEVARGEEIQIRESTSDGDEFEWEVTTTQTFVKGTKVSAGLFQTYSKATAGSREVTAIGKNWEFYTEEAPLEWSDVTCKLGEQFGELTAEEFLQGLFNQFNMVIVEDKYRKDHYKIIQYFDWILEGERRDWSDRVSNIRFSNIFQEQSKTIDFVMAEDDDIFGSLLVDDNQYEGSHYFKSTSETSEGDEEIGGFFGPLVNATQTKVYLPDDIVGKEAALATSSFRDGIPHIYEIDDNDKKFTTTAPKIGFRRPVHVDPFFYADGNNAPAYWNGTVNTLASSGYSGQGDTNFSSPYFLNTSSAYETYWKDYIDHLYHKGARKMTASVFFNPEDIRDFNINDTIHIQGTDYLISKINGFNLSRPDVIDVEFITYNNNFDTVFTDWTPRYVEDTTDIRTYTLAVEFTAQDDDSNAIPNTAIQDVFVASFTGNREQDYADNDGDAAAATFTQRITWSPRDGYDLSASNFTADVIPTGVTLGDFTDNGADVYVDATVTIQNADFFGTLEVSAEVDEIGPDVYSNSVTFQLASGLTDATIGNATKEVKGTQGAQLPVQVIIGAADDKSLDADEFTFTDTADVKLVGFSNLGFDVVAEFNVIIGSSNQSSTVTINAGDDYSVDRPGTGTSSIVVDFNESITNVSIAPSASFTIDGVAGAKSELNVRAYAAAGFTLAADNFSVSETADSSNVYAAGDAVGGGAVVEIPGIVTFPAEGTEATLTINVQGSAQAVGADLQTVTINFVDSDGNAIDENNLLDNIHISDESGDENFVGEYNTSLQYSLYINPDRGYEFATPLTTANVVSSDSNVISVTSVEGSDQGYVANCKINFGETETASANLTISATPVEEPYTHTIELTTDGLDNAYIDKGNTIITRYGAADFGTTDSVTVKVIPFDTYEFTADSDISFTIDSNGSTITVPDANKSQNSDGSYDFQIAWTYPSATDSQNPVAGLTLDATAVGGGVSVKQATEGEILTSDGSDVSAITIDKRKQVVSVQVATNGSWAMLFGGSSQWRQTNSMGTGTPNGGVDITFTQENNSSGDREVTLQLFPSASDFSDSTKQLGSTVTITQRNTYDTESMDVASIVILENSESFGSSTGVLYIKKEA